MALAEKSPYFDQVRPFLPKDVRLEDLIEVLPGSKYAEQIDSILLKVLTTPTGKNFCGAYSDNWQKFYGTLLISRDANSKGYSLCKGYFAPGVAHKIYKKTYYIGITNRTDHQATGWTNAHNETFLFVNPKADRPERFAYSLIHEVTISLDRKENTGFAGKINFSRSGLVENSAACFTSTLNRRPIYKSLFAALRAFDMERILGSEMKMEIPPYLQKLSSMSCAQRVVFMDSPIQPFLASLGAETLLNYFLDRPECQTDIIAPTTAEETAILLARLTLSVKDQGERSACDYMTQALPFIPGANFRGGPGPRIGGGW